jgi:hypothetical protein
VGKISNNILKSFVKEVIGNKNEDKVTSSYGVVSSKNENSVMVQLDGAPSGVLTPVECAMDVEQGDRVITEIKNHKAVVTGNISSPASARTANSYMKMTADGLMIGIIDEDGNPSNRYLLLGDKYYINDDDEVVAYFTDNEIMLGQTATKIKLCDGKSTIESYTNIDDGTDTVKIKSNTATLQIGTNEYGELFRLLTSANRGLKIEGRDDVGLVAEFDVDEFNINCNPDHLLGYGNGNSYSLVTTANLFETVYLTFDENVDGNGNWGNDGEIPAGAWRKFKHSVDDGRISPPFYTPIAISMVSHSKVGNASVNIKAFGIENDGDVFVIMHNSSSSTITGVNIEANVLCLRSS